MNSIFTAKLLQNLRNKKSNKGFTLIELLVVVIIIGVLAAVALPNLLAQVGKARESEGKTTVGSVNRAQQSYHFERQVFADDTNIETAGNPLGVVVDPEFYSFAIAGDATTGADAQVTTTALDGVNDGVRNYAGGIAYASGAYTSVLCQSNDVNGDATANADGETCDDGVVLN
jgi:type IV pilus assembly protein PilA